MKVSILIPVYKVERYIAQCAESLFAQTYKDVEYIFVDDCTPDDSIAVMQRVLEHFPERKEQVHIIRHAQNSGLGQARDTAFRAATGDFIMHVDSDDYIPLNAVELLVKRQQETHADIVDGGYQEVNREGKRTYKKPYAGSDKRFLRLALCQNIIPGRIWGRLYRRQLLVDTGIGNMKGIDYAEDMAVTQRIFLHAKRAVLDQPVYCYRMDNPASYTHSLSEKNINSFLKANQVVYDYYLTNDKAHQYRAALQIGMLNAVRMIVKEHFSQEQAAQLFHYKPAGAIFRCCVWALQGGLPYGMADRLYRTIRMVYRAFA